MSSEELAEILDRFMAELDAWKYKRLYWDFEQEYSSDEVYDLAKHISDMVEELRGICEDEIEMWRRKRK